MPWSCYKEKLAHMQMAVSIKVRGILPLEKKHTTDHILIINKPPTSWVKLCCVTVDSINLLSISLLRTEAVSCHMLYEEISSCLT